VVDDVAHLSPERISPDLSLKIHVTDDGDQTFVRHRLQEGLLPIVDLRPAGSQDARIRKVRRREDRARRGAVPALQPDPLGPDDVEQRIADRGITAAEIPDELLRAQARDRLEEAGIGPAVVAEEIPNPWNIDHRRTR